MQVKHHGPRDLEFTMLVPDLMMPSCQRHPASAQTNAKSPKQSGYVLLLTVWSSDVMTTGTAHCSCAEFMTSGSMQRAIHLCEVSCVSCFHSNAV